MENTQLIGLSYQMALRRQLDVVANNIANMNTTAFKGESMVFEEHLVKTLSTDKTARNLAFVHDLATIRDTSEGRTETTGGALDLAISGPGYFAVGTAEGERYTRNGHFKLDPEGRVVTEDGHPLLNADGDGFQLEPGEKDLTIAHDGSFTTSAGQKGKVKLAAFAHEQELKKVGESLYASDEKPEAVSGSDILQGIVEQSNVRPVIEITKMMNLVRTYEQVAQAMSQASDLNKEAIKELGQTPQA
jgi:flagellar basal-body rod protein FlgF